MIKLETKLQEISYMLQFIGSARFMAHYQTLSMIFLKELLKLNVNMGTVVKNVKFQELSINIPTALLNKQTLKMI